MYSNNIVNFQESTTILNACTKSLETYWMYHVQRKLNNLYNGYILFPNNDDKFRILADHELIQPQKDFLKMGPTCYLFNGFNHVQKQVEIEILYQHILKLQEQNQVKLKPSYATF